MRILLVEPPFYSFMQYDRWHFPLALAQLAAVAHAHGHEVMIYDGDKYFYKDISTKDRAVFTKKHSLYYENVDNLDYHIWRHFKGMLGAIKPDVVGVSVYTAKLKSAMNVLKIIREHNSDIKTCVGGAHVTGAPEAFIENSDVDGVFLGYADATFPQWLTYGCRREIVRGDPGEINLETLPYARREALLFPEFYSAWDMGILSTSRGCFGHCNFCSRFMYPPQIKFRTQESVRSELSFLLKRWKVKHVGIWDPSATDSPDNFKKTADVFKEYGVSWEAEGRWPTITREVLEYFVSCGCNFFAAGLESGSDKTLKYIRKGCTRKMIREKSKILNSLGIKWKICCIIGFPDETIDDMKQTMELAIEINPSSISLNTFCPLPGTDAYKDIPGITPEFASTLSQVYPSHCFSRHMDLPTYQKIFFEMTEAFDAYNRNKEEAGVMEKT